MKRKSVSNNQEVEREPIDVNKLNDNVKKILSQEEEWDEERYNALNFLNNKKKHKKNKKYYAVLKDIDNLLNNNNKSNDSEKILIGIKQRLESGEIDGNDAQHYLVVELLKLTTTPGKDKIADEELAYINSLRRKSSKVPMLTILSIVVLIILLVILNKLL